ncbi:unnamed protein product [Arabidopsis thaliana]|uniref:Plant thionin family protein n=1 Tax=Arabidopsis thaliana TaxID=3702 RepID=A0A654FHI9_ARATH|nr:unnamed protein product [Arabidopsis thaliana]VYS59722.1 unnamed protein product [Arabidopsis thaliana]
MEMKKCSMIMMIMMMVVMASIRGGEAIIIRTTCKQMCIDHCGGRITVPETPCLRKCLHEKCGFPAPPMEAVGMANIRG